MYTQVEYSLPNAYILCWLKWHNTQHIGHAGQFFLNELMFEIYSKGLGRTISKVLLMKFSYNTNENP